MSQLITTKYIVREVREMYQANSQPIIILCDTGEHFPSRRRLSIKSYDKENYEKARMLTKGDIFEIEEIEANITNEDGTRARLLKNLRLCFNVERL